MTSIYGEFERLVKENGKRVKISGLSNKESAWKIENFLILIDEDSISEEDRIIAVVDLNGGNFFYVIYLSPLALENGAGKFFGIIDLRISSEKRLEKIFKKLKKGQKKTGFFIKRNFC